MFAFDFLFPIIIRSGANYVRQHTNPQEHFTRGNAPASFVILAAGLLGLSLVRHITV